MASLVTNICSYTGGGGVHRLTVKVLNILPRIQCYAITLHEREGTEGEGMLVTEEEM